MIEMKFTFDEVFKQKIDILAVSHSAHFINDLTFSKTFLYTLIISNTYEIALENQSQLIPIYACCYAHTTLVSWLRGH